MTDDTATATNIKPKRERRTKLQMLAKTLGEADADALYVIVQELGAKKPRNLKMLRQLIDEHDEKPASRNSNVSLPN